MRKMIRGINIRATSMGRAKNIGAIMMTASRVLDVEDRMTEPIMEAWGAHGTVRMGTSWIMRGMTDGKEEYNTAIPQKHNEKIEHNIFPLCLHPPS